MTDTSAVAGSDAAGSLPASLGAARTRLAAAAGLPLPEQVASFDEVHRLLQDALAEVEPSSDGRAVGDTPTGRRP